jgi:uncharacterized membrane protein
MLNTIILIFYILVIPLLASFGSRKTKIIKWLSPIVTCYVIGVIAGNMPFLHFDKKLLTSVAEICVCLAIPLLLFSSNFLKWLKNSKWSFISFFLACFAVVISSSFAFMLFHDKIEDAWKIAGMMIGLYTGSTANMTAIGVALNVKEEVFVLLNSADLLIAGFYFLFLMTIAKKVFGLFLPKFRGYNGNQKQSPENVEAMLPLPFKKKALDFAGSAILSAMILAIAFGLSMLIFGKTMASFIILVITTLGILLSFFRPVRNLKSSYTIGDYLLLVFAVCIGSLASIAELMTANVAIIIFFIMAVFGSALIHLIGAYFFKIDTDTMIITSAAAIYGPAFIVPVAEGIKNREVIVSGLAMGLLGNAIGNYIGIGVAYLLNFIH